MEKESYERETEQKETQNQGSDDDEVSAHCCSSLFILPIFYTLTSKTLC